MEEYTEESARKAEQELRKYHEFMDIVDRIAAHKAPVVGDMVIENCGSVIIFRVVTPLAIRWVEEKVERGSFAPYWPSLVVAPENAAEIITHARFDGLVVR